MIRPSLQIRVAALHGGAAVQFPKDAALIASFKARFPKAIWGPGTRSWHIVGKMAVKRAELWAMEQAPLLQSLEQFARDREWLGTSSKPQLPVAAAGPHHNRVRTWRAIPGQPGRHCDDFPDGAPAAGITAIAKLNAQLVGRILFGFLRPPLLNCTCWPMVRREPSDAMPFPPEPTLSIVIDRSLTKRGGVASIQWEWRGIYGGEDWTEYGWHPDFELHALSQDTRAMIWGALNPGKRTII